MYTLMQRTHQIVSVLLWRYDVRKAVQSLSALTVLQVVALLPMTMQVMLPLRHAASSVQPPGDLQYIGRAV